MPLVQDPTEKDYRPITLEAFDLVHGNRNSDYGHPLDDFACTAKMVTAYLEHRGLLMPDAELEAEDIGPLMIMVKLSRQANKRKRDSMVDIAGYAETTEKVIYERARRAAVNARFLDAVQDALNERLTEAEAESAATHGISREAAEAAAAAGVTFNPVKGEGKAAWKNPVAHPGPDSKAWVGLSQVTAEQGQSVVHLQARAQGDKL